MEVRPSTTAPSPSALQEAREAKLEALRAMLLKRSLEFQSDSPVQADREDGKGVRLDIRV